MIGSAATATVKIPKKEIAPTVHFKWNGTERIMVVRCKTGMFEEEGSVCRDFKPNVEGLAELWNIAWPHGQYGTISQVIYRLWTTAANEDNKNRPVQTTDDEVSDEYTLLRATGLKIESEAESLCCSSCSIL